jgi:N,N-dimethylformamidase
MPTLAVRAYTDSLSYERGQTVSVHVSADAPVDIRLIRLQSSSSSDTSLDHDIDWQHAGRYPASLQQTCVGSFLLGELSRLAPPSSGTVTLGTFVWSANHSSEPVQTLLSLAEGQPFASMTATWRSSTPTKLFSYKAPGSPITNGTW